eukprot:TRINITY_DN8718_c0_g1_i1.p2 TRINITY_DN8718_c0_g1~~TRINITY_DN8718_c0_g1_i1.p2  ORF type:complete len:180 (-),score=38.44 TRINITY_DN8718_c0_g1_i1:135-674(-)
MKNVFFTAQEIHKRYDLKGSTFSRFTTDLDQSVARKDLNAIEDNFKLLLSQEDQLTYQQQIENDCKFFEKNNIIDYSLLIGIHEMPKEQIENPQENLLKGGRGIYYSTNKKFIYYIGIIDFLTSYNIKKSMEHAIKRIFFGKTISAIPPKPYAQRFKHFANQLLDINNKNYIPPNEYLN